jgi:hypothetical protein
LGQAKVKGSYEQRKEQAIATARAGFPDSVKCNNCNLDLTEIVSMDTRGLIGLRKVGAAICDACSQTTWILDGSPQSLAEFSSYISEESDGEIKLGSVMHAKKEVQQP